MDETIEIPGYKIERHLGSGATATVYLAEHINLQRKVAIKLMTTGLVTDASFRERFMQEGRVVAQLNHPNIVTVFDINEYNANYYMVMEYVDGGMTLRDKIQDGLELDEAITIICEIGAALGYAHKRRFVHRDVKPANILFREEGTAVLSDFGIARVVGQGSQLTQQGYTVGTPAYMSPEQVLGQEIGIRSDLYSLGVVFYEMLTGKAPFHAQETFALAMKHVNDRPPLLPRDLEAYQAVLDKAMAKKP
jgi:serine/threonine-protein kinase PpkA